MTHNISALNIAKPFFIQKTSLPVLPNYSSSTSVMHSEAPSSSKPSSSKPSSASENRSKQLAVFYNTYTNPNNTEHAFEVIFVQLKVSNQSPLVNLTIYYSRFGDLEFKWPLNKCRNKKVTDNVMKFLPEKRGVKLKHFNIYMTILCQIKIIVQYTLTVMVLLPKIGIIDC
mgnify:CR=1 FL=1